MNTLRRWGEVIPRLWAIVLAFALLIVPAGIGRAQLGKLTLHPSGFGEHSYAAWKAGEGLPDSRGNASQALYFQKMTETFVFAAGIAIVEGLAGMPASVLQGLEWEHRDDGWCGSGAPRWNVGLTAAGLDYTVFLGCFAAAHTPGSSTGWTRDSYPGPAIAAQITSQTGLPAPFAGVTIRYLAIVFDEGTTLQGAPYGLGFVYLDNLRVNQKTWTSAGDNGN